MTYTEEDFRNATIAVRGTHSVAHRVYPGTSLPWFINAAPRLDDAEMAEGGWTPIREANGLHDRDTYINHIEEQERVIRARNKRIAELMALLPENRPTPEHTPLTLDTLRDAWESAEVPTMAAPVGKGDVLIRKDDDASIDVWECQTGHHPAVGETRVLSRAPREPWADLADDLADRSAIMDEDAIEAAAKALHAAGWRKGDDER